jgi:hypothetical protein
VSFQPLRMALVMVVLANVACVDFELEKQKLCKQYPARCGDAGGNNVDPDAGTGTDAGGPPRVTDTQPKSPMAQPGSVLSFQVTVATPPAGALSFVWSTTLGTLGAQTDGRLTSTMPWTAPACIPGGVPPILSVTITNSLGPSTSTRFLVGGLPDCPVWRPSSAVTAKRTGFTATELKDGRILIVGGTDGSQSLATAELYDPVTDTVTPTGSLSSIRVDHSATLLSDGRVLVMGGRIGWATGISELYDPSTGTWSTTEGMSTSRMFHASVLLGNGKVLVVGGASSSTAELYDPTTGSWSSTGSMAQVRQGHTLTVLKDSGLVLATGGGRAYFGSGGVPLTEALASAELYDPATGVWTSTGSMAQARREGHSATVLGSGKVLVLGGTGASSPTNTGELYDPATGTWTAIRAMAPPGRSGHGASLLPSGKVLVSGGSYSLPLKTAELYDPERDVWSSTAELGEARTGHASLTIPHGGVVLLGGGVTQVERYEPGVGWKLVDPMAVVRSYHTMTLLPSGQVLVVGGGFGSTRLESAEVFDPLTGHWSRVEDMRTPRGDHTATLLPSGKVLVAGGAEQGSAAELYDPDSKTWSPTGALNLERTSATATLLPSGRVLVTGGTGGAASAELYDPVTGAWSYTASMGEDRVRHTATLLSSGKVLVTCGQSGSTYLASTELYDEAAGSWTAANPLRTVRREHSATLLPSGQVLVVGGYRVITSGQLSMGASTEQADAYVPENGEWTALGGMTAGGFMRSGRHFHIASLLPDGRVLVMGGLTAVGGNTYNNSTAEAFDPSTGNWTPTLRPQKGRQRGHRALLLPTGRVLVTGGTDEASAEVYIP